MLSLEPPFYDIDGILIYRDHADPTLFYYSASAPRIARVDGRLAFDLMAYRVELKNSVLAGTSIPDELGAGFLTLCTECAAGDAKADLLGKLQDKTGISQDKLSLFPVPYHKGTVSVIALDKFVSPSDTPQAPDPARPLAGKPTFVENVLGTGKPSLMGDLRCILSLSLSQDGVSFLEGLYEDGAAPVGVVYELAFYGLSPTLDVSITANLSNIYQHFGGGLSVQCCWFKADVEAALDYLRQRGDIRIKYTGQKPSSDPGVKESMERAMSLFRDRIIQELFKPTAPDPSPGIPPAMGTDPSKNGNLQSSLVCLTLQCVKKEELKEITYDFNERSPEVRTHSPQGFLPLLLTKDELEQHMHLIDLHHPFFDELNVLVTGPTKQEFQDLGIRDVTAAFTYGAPEDTVAQVTDSLLFRSDSTGDKTFAAMRQGRKSLAYSVALSYEFYRDSGLQGDSFVYRLPPRPGTGRSLLINPAMDFGFLDVEVAPGHIHPDVLQVDVDLAYTAADGHFNSTDHYRFRPGQADATGHRWRVRTRNTDVGAYTAAYTLAFEDGVYHTKAKACTDRLLRVDTPFTGNRELLIKPVPDSDQVELVTVELDYHDEANDYRRLKRVDIASPFNGVRIRWPILDVNRQTVKYRVTVQETGNVYCGEWQQTDDPSILAGRGHEVRSVRIQLIGPPLKDLGIDALCLDVSPRTPDSPEDTIRVLFTGDKISDNVELKPLPGQPAGYRYRLIAFKADGTSTESAWKDDTSAFLVLQTRNL